MKSIKLIAVALIAVIFVGAFGACDVTVVEDGKSAYEIWLDLGNEGTEQDFIDSLKGKDGAPGIGIPGTPGRNGIDTSNTRLADLPAGTYEPTRFFFETLLDCDLYSAERKWYWWGTIDVTFLEFLTYGAAVNMNVTTPSGGSMFSYSPVYKMTFICDGADIAVVFYLFNKLPQRVGFYNGGIESIELNHADIAVITAVGGIKAGYPVYGPNAPFGPAA